MNSSINAQKYFLNKFIKLYLSETVINSKIKVSHVLKTHHQLGDKITKKKGKLTVTRITGARRKYETRGFHTPLVSHPGGLLNDAASSTSSQRTRYKINTRRGYHLLL